MRGPEGGVIEGVRKMARCKQPERGLNYRVVELANSG